MEPTTNTSTKNSSVILLLIIIILLLATAFTYLFYTSNKNKTVPEPKLVNQTIENNQINSITSNEQSKYKTISLNSVNAPLAYTFEIPADYVAYIEEGYEGGYGARIKVLKELSPGIFKNAGVSFWITAESERNAKGKGGIAGVEAVYKNNALNSKYITLAGNKAVQSKGEMDEKHLFTLGFVENSRTPQYPYFIESHYAPEFIQGNMLSEDEYQRILQTLKVVENKSY